MQCGFVNDLNVSNRTYLSKFQSSEFEEFINRSTFEDRDKQVLRKIFDSGKQAVELFDRMMTQSMDVDQY